MHPPTFTQAELVEALAGTNPDRRQWALRCLFEDARLRQSAIAHVRRHGGNRQDGEDVFQEAILLFDRKIRQGAFLGQGSLGAYFMGIVRWSWFNEQKRANNAETRLETNPPERPAAGNPEIEFLLAERREQLDTLLEQLTDKCRNLLKMYQLDYTMDEIARQMGYANSGVAKKESFLCRQRLRLLLKKHAEYWNDLIKPEQ